MLQLPPSQLYQLMNGHLIWLHRAQCVLWKTVPVYKPHSWVLQIRKRFGKQILIPLNSEFTMNTHFLNELTLFIANYLNLLAQINKIVKCFPLRSNSKVSKNRPTIVQSIRLWMIRNSFILVLVKNQALKSKQKYPTPVDIAFCWNSTNQIMPLSTFYTKSMRINWAMMVKWMYAIAHRFLDAVSLFCKTTEPRHSNWRKMWRLHSR